VSCGALEVLFGVRGLGAGVYPEEETGALSQFRKHSLHPLLAVELGKQDVIDVLVGLIVIPVEDVHTGFKGQLGHGVFLPGLMPVLIWKRVAPATPFGVSAHATEPSSGGFLFDHQDVALAARLDVVAHPSIAGVLAAHSGDVLQLHTLHAGLAAEPV